jgi:hypothetical protein
MELGPSAGKKSPARCRLAGAEVARQRRGGRVGYSPYALFQFLGVNLVSESGGRHKGPQLLALQDQQPLALFFAQAEQLHGLSLGGLRVGCLDAPEVVGA